MKMINAPYSWASNNSFRGPRIFNKNLCYLIGLFLLTMTIIKCNKDQLNQTNIKIESIITDYHTIYTDSIQIQVIPTNCNDNSFDFHVKYIDKQFNKSHAFGFLYYGFGKQKSPINSRLFCRDLSSEQKSKFTPFFSGFAYYEEDDVPSTFYFLDTNKINKFEVDFNDKTQHKIKFDLNLVKRIGPGRNTIGPGIDSFHIIAPEFLAKVWY